MIRTLSPDPYRTTLSVTDLSPQGDLSWLGIALTFRVTGWSMFPTLRHGDVLDVVPAEPVIVGDLVLFRQARTLICHRVLALPTHESVRTRGDGMEGEGETVRRADLAGKVAVIRRRGRALDPRHPPSDTRRAWLARGLHGLGAEGTRLGVEAIVRVAHGLAGARALRPIATTLLRRAVSFAVGLPAPVKLLAAYHFVPVGRRPIPWDRVRRRLGDPAAWPDAIVLARVGTIPLGTLLPTTGSVQVRRAIEGLGVEDALRAVTAEWLALCGEVNGKRP